MRLLDTLAVLDREPLPARLYGRVRLANLGMQAVSLPEGPLRGHTFHRSRTGIHLTSLAMGTPPCAHGRPEPLYRLGRLTTPCLKLYCPSNPAATRRLPARLTDHR